MMATDNLGNEKVYEIVLCTSSKNSRVSLTPYNVPTVYDKFPITRLKKKKFIKDDQPMCLALHHFISAHEIGNTPQLYTGNACGRNGVMT